MPTASTAVLEARAEALTVQLTWRVLRYVSSSVTDSAVGSSGSGALQEAFVPGSQWSGTLCTSA